MLSAAEKDKLQELKAAIDILAKKQFQIEDEILKIIEKELTTVEKIDRVVKLLPPGYPRFEARVRRRHIQDGYDRHKWV